MHLLRPVLLFLVLPIVTILLFNVVFQLPDQLLSTGAYSITPSISPTAAPTEFASLGFMTIITPSITPQKKKTNPTTATNTSQPQPTQASYTPGKLKMLKDVGEAYMDHFGLTTADFQRMRAAGFTLIQSNFDICAYEEDVRYFLDQSAEQGIKVILPAGSGEAEWGYQCDVVPTANQAPNWQKDSVQKWVQKYKSHSAVYAWDTSNEAGGNFPNASDKALRLTAQQLQTAYADIKAVDSQHPIMIRMNGWFFYDSATDFFPHGNPFAPNMADIVMINAYSNVDEYFDDFVQTVTSRAKSAITQIDGNTQFIVALGAWNEPPLWSTPTIAHLQHDYNQAKVADPITIAFFKYGADKSEWYYPTSAPNIWSTISGFN